MKNNLLVFKCGLALLFGIILLVGGCQKDSFVLKDRPEYIRKSALDSLERIFNERNYKGKLLNAGENSSSILWNLKWEAASSKVNANDSFIYIPLEPVSKGGDKTIKFMNERRFLVIKNKSAFFKADYISAEVGAVKAINFANMNGILFLDNLESGELYKYEYKDGFISKGTEKKLDKKMSLKNTEKTSVWQVECHNEYYCTYSADCDNTVYIYTNMFGCEAPNRDQGVGTCSVANWSYQYSQARQVCENVYYPDAPPYPDPIPEIPNPQNPEQSKPCPGDAVKNPTIAESKPGNSRGGRYGNTRKNIDGSTRFHGGIDIFAQPNTILYPIMNGTVVRVVRNISPGEYVSAKSFGNLIEIESTLPSGQKVRILYAHLNHVPDAYNVGSAVSTSQSIGLTGKTGNAAKATNPHVHIQVKLDGNSVNPEDYLRTKFDSAGNPTNPCN